MELDRSKLVVVTGGRGFHRRPSRGGAPAARLRARSGRSTSSRSARWYQQHDGVENVSADLRESGRLPRSGRRRVDVFNLAADMGGMGFIETHKADCMVSVLINTHMLRRVARRGRRAVHVRLVGVRLRRRASRPTPTSPH